MAPRKKAAVAAEASNTIPSNEPPKRELRKRKQINYKERTERDVDVVGAPVKKVKTTNSTGKAKTRGKNVAETVDAEDAGATEIVPATTRTAKPAPPRRKRKARDDDGESRKRDYVSEPSIDFKIRLDRSLREPLQFVDRERCDIDETPRETFTIAGSIGYHYTIEIRHVLTCTCPDFRFRRASCKHILYTLVKVLKVSPDSNLLYQTALTSAELKAMFDAAPAAPHIDLTDVDDPNRKSMEDQECPICYCEFQPTKQRVAYCKGSCGNNVHQTCIDTWLRSQRSMYGKATCPYCRQNWVG
ncbi:hypothetical protein P280DRAFT_547792 [Massarina eburnea CBS 473.64]|uniref:Uncharacterized protein n=1 Tax=Massarina eburnea CBS 473.64 TaxID=1395130 RepID=A0A6A6S790_9PLEO|nr:hypothetical protein P280DRAFT_547792 [Massarina eburnea CBS 473.64]